MRLTIKNTLSSIDSFLNSGLSQAQVGVVILRQHRVINVCMLMVILLACFYSLRALQLEIYLRMISLLTTCCLCLLSILILRSIGSLGLAANVGCTGVLIAVAMSVYTNGGLGSSATAWILLLPLMAGVMCGARGGLCWGGISLLLMVVLVLLEAMGLQIEDLTPPNERSLQTGLNQLGQLVSVCALIVCHSYSRDLAESAQSASIEKLSIELRQQKKHLDIDTALACEAKGGLLAEPARRASKGSSASVLGFKGDSPINKGSGNKSIGNRAAGNNVKVSSNPVSAKATVHALPFIETISDKEELVQHFVNDVIDLAKLDAALVELSLESCHMEVLLRDIIASLHGIARRYRLFILQDFSPTEPVTIDVQRMRRVFNILIGNGLKYTEEGGVTVYLKPSDKLDGVRVDIIDTGIGISLRDQAKLFAARTDIKTEIRKGGSTTGLGLALSQGWVALHGGVIEVSSQIGVGSQFSVHLPFVPKDIAR